MCTYVTGVHSSNSDTAIRLDGSDHLIQEFRGICLETKQGLEVVRPSLGIFTSGTLKADVLLSFFLIIWNKLTRRDNL